MLIRSFAAIRRKPADGDLTINRLSREPAGGGQNCDRYGRLKQGASYVSLGRDWVDGGTFIIREQELRVFDTRSLTPTALIHYPPGSPTIAVVGKPVLQSIFN